MKSNCCNKPIKEDSDICSYCKEHCEIKRTKEGELLSLDDLESMGKLNIK